MLVTPADMWGYTLIEVLADGCLKASDVEGHLWLLEPVPEAIPNETLDRVRALELRGMPRLGPVTMREGARYLPVEWPQPGPPGPIAPGRLLPDVRLLVEGLGRLWTESGEQLPLSISLAGNEKGRLRLARLLEAGPTPVMQHHLIAQLARALARVYTGQEASSEVLFDALPMRLAWTLERAMSGKPERSFSNWTEFGEALCREAPSAVVFRPHPQERRLPPVPHRAPRRSRVPLLMGLLVLAGGLGWLALRWTTAPPLPPVSQPAVVVAAGDELLVYRAADGSLLGRVSAGERIGGVAGSDKGVVVATLPGSSRLLLVDLRAGGQLLYALADQNPVRIEADWDGTHFFVVEPRARILVAARLLPREQWTRRCLSLEALFAVSCPEVITASGHVGESWLAYAADPCRGELVVFDVGTGRRLACRNLGRASALASSPGQRCLFVAIPGAVAGLDPRTLTTVCRFEVSPTSPVVELLLSEDLGSLTLVHANGEVHALDLSSGARLAGRRLPGRLREAVRLGDEIWILADDRPRLVVLGASLLDVRLELDLPAGTVGLAAVRGR